MRITEFPLGDLTLGTITGFGYSVPRIVVIVFVALVLGIALAVLFWLTVGWSTYRSVQRTRRDRVRDDLQSELLDHLFEPDVDWEPWVTGLSGTEREVVESLLDEYLRELDGSDADKLRGLGRELGIPERSTRQLQSRGEYTRLSALTWLTLLREPDPLAEVNFEPQTPRERASVARLRYESDDLDSPAEGVDILLGEATTQFTIFGQDTLFQIATEDPVALFSMAADQYQQWSISLLVQVLVVCQHVGSTVTSEDVSWVIAMLEHDNEPVRAAAAQALGQLGWRTDLRDDLLGERLVMDPSPRVRGAIYEMLAAWGDSRALDLLTRTLETELDDRARLTGTNALVEHSDRLPETASAELGATWAWSSEHAEYDDRARKPRRVSE
ncbi:HEAT repeat domain-containing protein [Halovenus sp. HT40]|uniref:HEAT repeat domain-containing protein n=1 Tax=Halovenus sp. HT40 TaxID=3126691 RepID=UPI00300F08E6